MCWYKCGSLVIKNNKKMLKSTKNGVQFGFAVEDTCGFRKYVKMSV